MGTVIGHMRCVFCEFKAKGQRCLCFSRCNLSPTLRLPPISLTPPTLSDASITNSYLLWRLGKILGQQV